MSLWKYKSYEGRRGKYLNKKEKFSNFDIGTVLVTFFIDSLIYLIRELSYILNEDLFRLCITMTFKNTKAAITHSLS